VPVAPAGPQPNAEESRIATREKLRKLLETHGPSVNVAFRQSDEQPFIFVGSMNRGLANAESLEILIAVTAHETIGFRIFPHYKGGYINVGKAKDSAALMRQLLLLSDRVFLFWGADESGDVFAGYTFTLESGFPEEGIRVVLNSIKNLDKFVGEMRPAIDGSAASAPPPSADPAKLRTPAALNVLEETIALYSLSLDELSSTHDNCWVLPAKPRVPVKRPIHRIAVGSSSFWPATRYLE